MLSSKALHFAQKDAYRPRVGRCLVEAGRVLDTACHKEVPVPRRHTDGSRGLAAPFSSPGRRRVASAIAGT
jgi:hypothetical protein